LMDTSPILERKNRVKKKEPYRKKNARNNMSREPSLLVDLMYRRGFRKS